MAYDTKTRNYLINEFINALKQDRIPWEKPWKSHYNAITNHEYTGVVNQTILAYMANMKGYDDPRWCTFVQAKSKGWIVHGHGVPIEFWSAYDTRTKRMISLSVMNKLISENPEAARYIKMIVKTYTVFNAKQLEGIPPLEEKTTLSEEILLDRFKAMVSGMGVQIKTSAASAFYSPSKDTINMPFGKFKDQKSYCATLLHEAAHATGHPSRLNRNINNDFGTIDYAKEELRAEIASAFLLGEFDLSYDANHMQNHKAYIQSWISILQNNPDELFAAMKDADKITDYMMELCPQKEHTLEEKPLSLSERIQQAQEQALRNKETSIPNKECDLERGDPLV